MKKLVMIIVIIIIFISLFLMPMAWGMGLPEAEDSIALQERIATAQYKDDLYMSAADRMMFKSAPADSEAGRAYALYLQKFKSLPRRCDLNWAEQIYHEHTLAIQKEKSLKE